MNDFCGLSVSNFNLLFIIRTFVAIREEESNPEIPYQQPAKDLRAQPSMVRVRSESFHHEHVRNTFPNGLYTYSTFNTNNESYYIKAS